MLNYDDLKEKPREFLAATGLTQQEFEILLPNFLVAEEKLYPQNLTLAGALRQRSIGAGRKGSLTKPEDRLLFILVYQKTNPLQTMLGLQFCLSQPQTNFWIHHLLPVLQETLSAIGMKPEREACQVGSNLETIEGGANLAIDGTERRLQRPTDPVKQKEKYSGKKKAHTDKNIVLVNQHTKRVVYLSPTVEGKKHDSRAAHEAAIVYPAFATLDKDSGFQGYEPEDVLTQQPKKKAQGKELSVGDKVCNKIFSSVRIVVENCLSGVKRCRIVKDLLRLTKQGISDQVMEIACGLHNLRVTCRQPLLTFDLIDLVDSAYFR